MNHSWRIEDLIDLEFFLDLDFDSGMDAPEEADFDRQVFLSYPGHERWRDAPSARSVVLGRWLEERRRRERRTGAPSPGEFVAEGLGLVRLLLSAVALLFGALLTWRLLGYRGQAPVNVFTFLWVLVVPQVFLLAALTLSVLLVPRRRGDGAFRIGYPVIAAVIRGVIGRIGRFASARIGAERESRLREAFGLLGKTKTVYGSVFFWPVFQLAQLAGIFFNLGILGALLLKVAVTDLAFGWQTTLRLSTESLLRIVETVSWPWSWLSSPPTAHPTVAQIEGSRMILKDGMVHLATGDLVAWWPFLFLTVFCYAFLPRLALAGTGRILFRRALRALDFSHGRCDRLIARMTTPRLDTCGEPDPDGGPGAAAPVHPAATIELSGNDSMTTAGPGAMTAVALAPEEIYGRLHPEELARRLRERLGLDLLEVVPVETDALKDADRLRRVLDAARRRPGEFVSVRVVVVQEAWQPPIRESLDWLLALRTVAGKTTGVIVALIGKPRPDTIWTPPADTDRTVWSRVVDSLGDVGLRVESLVGDTRKGGGR